MSITQSSSKIRFPSLIRGGRSDLSQTTFETCPWQIGPGLASAVIVWKFILLRTAPFPAPAKPQWWSESKDTHAHILFKDRFSPVGKSCESEAKGGGSKGGKISLTEIATRFPGNVDSEEKKKKKMWKLVVWSVIGRWMVELETLT